MIRRSFCLLMTVALVGFVGCGSDDGLGKRYRVTGTVKYKGQPLEKGTISFVPATPDPKGINIGATGVIENGSYSLSAQGDVEGAFPGEYLVTVDSRKVDLSKAAANAQGGGSFRQDDVAKANASAESLIPKKYLVPDTSGLKATVKESSNSIDFELVD
jgi:hypothetical protein